MKYNQRVIEFFKKHNMYDEKVFDYLQENSVMLDYKEPEQRDVAGCYYIQNSKEILQRLIIYIPYVYNDITALLNIHEITHGVENYKKIGKYFERDITIDALPILYEKIYIMENSNEYLINYSNNLDQIRANSGVKEYIFALNVRDKLLENYNYDMNKMQKLSKKLVHKYH